MNVTVAAPTARLKDYSLPQWEAATRGHRRLLVTEERDYIPVIENMGIRAEYYEPPPPSYSPLRHVMCSNRFNVAWAKILEHVDTEYVLSLETDVIPPEDVDIVEVMKAEWDGTVDFLVHLYPYRSSYNREGQRCFEMGCTLARTDTWMMALALVPPTGALYQAPYSDYYPFTHRRIEPVQLSHLDGPGMVGNRLTDVQSHDRASDPLGGPHG